MEVNIMAKKQPKMPMVSSVSARIRATTFSATDSEVTTPEDTVKRKKNFLSILDKAAEKIAENIENGKMTLDSSLDLDRIIRLSLLVSGEADNITGKVGKEVVEEQEIEAKKISMAKIEQILTLDDPEVKQMYDKLYESYNKLNDEASEE